MNKSIKWLMIGMIAIAVIIPCGFVGWDYFKKAVMAEHQRQVKVKHERKVTIESCIEQYMEMVPPEANQIREEHNAHVVCTDLFNLGRLDPK